MKMTQSKSLAKTAAAFIFIGSACFVSLSTAPRAHAQNSMAPAAPMQNSMSSGAPMQNVVPQSEEVTLQAKITHIDTSTRAVTLKGPKGDKVTVTAGPN